MARSASPKATLTTKTGRVFAAMPRSNNQTSPRAGNILFPVEKGRERFSGFANLFIGKRARIERQFASPP